MDLKSSELVTDLPRRKSKRSRPPSQIGRLHSIRINAGTNTEMEIRNWKLYMENKAIMEQNERLRQRALLLQCENQTLLSQLQNKHSHHHYHPHLQLGSASNSNTVNNSASA